MALLQLFSLPAAPTFTEFPPRDRMLSRPSNTNLNPNPHPGRIQCIATTETSNQTIIRRSANYQRSSWDHGYIQSLTSKYAGKSSVEQVEKLKGVVRLMLDEVPDHLELIDTLQRLGLSYHFETEIKGILSRIYNNNLSNYMQKQASLHDVALAFRLLRQHGYDIAADIFNNFKDENGKFKPDLIDDCKGILSLYEAAFLLKEGEESIFYEARSFTTTYLREYVNQNEDPYLSTLVNHALELPLHWRMPRVEARWFIDAYGRKQDFNPLVLELAKLDFNVVQAIHQGDLKYASSWWNNSRMSETLSFARDRWMVSFLWTVGMSYEPQFAYCRKMSAKVNAMITVIDDIYDVYGTLEELELFTDIVNRWDVNAAEQLPHYMRIAFLALYNAINEMGYDALDQGIYAIPYLRKSWAGLCKAYLQEAKWFHSKYVPTLDEFIENALVSISAPVILVHAYILTKEDVESLQEYDNIIRWSSILLRLADDLGTSSDEMERGDVHKSVQCYMHETGASEEDARKHVQELITTTWMKMNKDGLGKPHLSNTFIRIAMNLARMAQFVYLHGDGHGKEETFIKDDILSLLMNPIQ